jgi:Ran GTPase-activating protein (RanGAP) involved in mRNA processing and transport
MENDNSIDCVDGMTLQFHCNENSNRNIAIQTLLQELGEKPTDKIKALSCRKLLDDDAMTLLLKFIHQNHTILHLRTLSLPTNLMTVSSAPTLAKIVEYQLDSLMDLDLSNNAAVFSGEDGSGLKHLVDAICSENGAAVVHCRVQRLNLSRNAIGRVGKAVKHIRRLLCKNSTLRHLNLAQNYLGQRHMDSDGGLHNNSTLLTIDLSGNALRDAGVHTLMKAINQRVSGCVSKLEEIDLSDNMIGCKGAEHIANLLGYNRNTTLQKLNLSKNVIKSDGAKNLRLVMRYNHTLRELDLSENGLCCSVSAIDGLRCISESLRRSEASSLLRLNLSWNCINDDGAIALADVLRSNSKLESLDLSNNAIGNDGFNALIDALPYDIALKELHMRGNQISNEEALVAYICNKSYKLVHCSYEQNNLTLAQEANIVAAYKFQASMQSWLGKLLTQIKQKEIHTLKLVRKEYGDKELIAISNCLVQYPTEIRTMFLSSKHVTDQGFCHLADHVLTKETAYRIVHLYCLAFPRLTARGIDAVARSLAQRESSLTSLTLVGCNIGTDGAVLLAKALESNISLKALSLESNLIADRGARAIWEAILDPPHANLVMLNLANNALSDDALLRLGRFVKLKDIRLDQNDISDAGALSICRAVTGGSSLEYLNLCNNPRLSSKGIQALQLFLPSEFVLHTDFSCES